MFSLRNLRKRTEGLDYLRVYDSIIANFHCVHSSSPPPTEIGCPLLSCAFAKKPNHGHILAATCDNGRIILVNTEKEIDNAFPYHVQAVNYDALFSVVWSDVDMKLLTTSGNHLVTLFDVEKNNALVELNTFRAHTKSVKTACFKPQSASVFATGGRDGNIYVWDARNKTTSDGRILPEQSIVNSHHWTGLYRTLFSGLPLTNFASGLPGSRLLKYENTPRITSILFQEENKLISCADTDSMIKIWDLRKTYLTHMIKPQFYSQFSPQETKKFIGYSHMVINKNTTQVYANCMNNNIYCFNVASFSSTLDYVYNGHRCNSFYVKSCLSPDEKYLASTDSNDKVYIWRTGVSSLPVVQLDGNPKGLSDVSWCPEDQLKLATSSDHPSPWIWSALPDVPSKQPLGHGFAVILNMNHHRRKCKRLSSMAVDLSKYSVHQENELDKLVLPNAVIDGKFQTHMCTKTEPKSNGSGNWLMNFHNQQWKEAVSPKQIKKLAVRNRVSPKIEKSPGIRSRGKQIKRKRLDMSAGSNNLTKYFKSSDENREVQTG